MVSAPRELNFTFICSCHHFLGKVGLHEKTQKGKNWSKLSIPDHQITYHTGETKWEKKSVRNGETLNLHLEDTTTDLGMYAPSVQSKESAPGYIIAHGSVGRSLENNPALFQLYVSYDGQFIILLSFCRNAVESTKNEP